MKKYLPLFILVLLITTSCQDEKVIKAFGYMNEKLEESNNVLATRNEVHLDILNSNIEKEPIKYKSIKEKSERVVVISSNFYNYLEDLKDEIYNAHIDPEDEEIDYRKLSSSKFVDGLFFNGEKSTEKGKEFLNKVNHFKINIANALGRGFASISSIVNARFRTDPIKGRKGVEIPWLNFKFKGFPAITSITNITQMQTDLKLIESELLLSMISGEFERELAMRNFIGVVQLNKTSYLEGEIVKGKILLGRYDTSVTPQNVFVNGTKVSEKYLREGEVNLNFRANGIGEHPLTGVFTVMEEGEPVQIRFNSSYTVIREFKFDGSNPINAPTIITQVPVRKTRSTTSSPTPIPTPKVVTAFDEKSERLEGTLGREYGFITVSKKMLTTSTIGALHYDSNTKYKAVSFTIKVDGTPPIKITGNKLNSRARKALAKVRRGQRIKIYNIKVKSSTGGRLSDIEPIAIKIK